MGIYLF